MYTIDRSMQYLQILSGSAKTQHLSVLLEICLGKDERLFQVPAGHPCFFDEFCVFAWLIDQFSPWWHSESFREEGFWSMFVIRLSHSCCNSCFSDGTATF